MLVATVVIGELIVGLGERGAGVEGVMVVDGQDMLMLAVEVGDMEALVSIEVVELLVATLIGDMQALVSIEVVELLVATVELGELVKVLWERRGAGVEGAVVGGVQGILVVTEGLGVLLVGVGCMVLVVMGGVVVVVVEHA